MGISKNLAFYGLNPSPFSGREGYKEFLETPLYNFDLQSIPFDRRSNIVIAHFHRLIAEFMNQKRVIDKWVSWLSPCKGSRKLISCCWKDGSSRMFQD